MGSVIFLGTGYFGRIVLGKNGLGRVSPSSCSFFWAFAVFLISAFAALVDIYVSAIPVAFLVPVALLIIAVFEVLLPCFAYDAILATYFANREVVIVTFADS